MAITTPTDVLKRWVDAPESPDLEVIATLIDDAEDTIASEFKTILDNVADGDFPKNRFVKVVARMVIRHLRNPEGLRSYTDSTGPMSTTAMYGGDTPGEMYLTDYDRAELTLKKAPAKSAYSFSMMPTTAQDYWGVR